MLSVKSVLLESIEPSDHDLKKKTVKNTMWSSTSMAVRVFLTVISMPIIARLLSPEDFGIAALATLITEVIALFGEFGLQSALIQRKRIYRIDLETAFWSEVFLGLALAAILLLISPFASEYFEIEELTFALSLTAAGLVLISMTAVHKTLLVRTLRFKELSIVEITSSIIRVSTAIILAWSGFGFWSLVVAGVTSFFVTAVLRFYFLPWIPRLRFNKHRFYRMFRFGRNILGDNLLTYVSNNVDSLIIGKQLGSEALGYYQIALTMPDMIRKNTQQILSRVLFPAYSRVQNDRERLHSAFLDIVGGVAFIIFPVIGGFFAIAPIFVPLYFGDQWLVVIVPAQMLCIVAASRTIMAMCGPVIHSQGRPDVTMKLSLFRIPFLILAIMIGLSWGITGIAVSLAALSFIWVLIFLYVTSRIIGLYYGAIMARLIPPVISVITMVLVVQGIHGFVSQNEMTGLMYELFILVLSGIVFYSIFTLIFCRKTAMNTYAIFRSTLGKQ